MPAQSGKTSALDLLKKAGVAKAFESHKGDETKLSAGGDLPPGINQGVAQLTVAKLDIHKDGANKDKPYVMFTGICTQPEEVVGLRAMKLIGLYAGTGANAKSQDDRVAEALNEMRKLGVDTKSLTFDQWEDALLGLEQEGPFFRFRTWQGQATKEFPNPRVNLDFRGKIDNYDGPQVPDAVNDQSGADAGDGSGGGDDTGATANDESGEDWTALGEAADSGDTDAEKKVYAKAGELGIDSNSIATWSETAAAIVQALEGGGDGSGGEAPASWQPAETDIYKFKPKGATKAIECEVTKVFEKTLNLKEVKGGKIHKGVTWSADPDTLGGAPLITT